MQILSVFLPYKACPAETEDWMTRHRGQSWTIYRGSHKAGDVHFEVEALRSPPEA